MKPNPQESTVDELPEKNFGDKLFSSTFYAVLWLAAWLDLFFGWLVRWVRKNLN